MRGEDGEPPPLVVGTSVAWQLAICQEGLASKSLILKQTENEHLSVCLLSVVQGARFANPRNRREVAYLSP